MPVRYSNNGGRPEGAPPAGYQQRLQFYDREETELLVKLKRTDKKECGEVIWETTIERKRNGEEAPTRVKTMHISRIQPNKLRLWMEAEVGEVVGEDETPDLIGYETVTEVREIRHHGMLNLAIDGRATRKKKGNLEKFLEITEDEICGYMAWHHRPQRGYTY